MRRRDVRGFCLSPAGTDRPKSQTSRKRRLCATVEHLSARRYISAGTCHFFSARNTGCVALAFSPDRAAANPRVTKNGQEPRERPFPVRRTRLPMSL
jgi:hypothetical protein